MSNVILLVHATIIRFEFHNHLGLKPKSKCSITFEFCLCHACLPLYVQYFVCTLIYSNFEQICFLINSFNRDIARIFTGDIGNWNYLILHRRFLSLLFIILQLPKK
jgi:hypothetical protein